MTMKLAVSSWFPYRYQAAALQQLLRDQPFEIVPLEDAPGSVYSTSLGPFLVMTDDVDELPIMGIFAIAEVLDRKFPGRGILGTDPVSRTFVRALAAMIDERFSRLCVAAIACHASFGRQIWHSGSDAPRSVLDTPPPVETIDRQLSVMAGAFAVGDTPSIADSLLAALWWTAEDLGHVAELGRSSEISAWHARTCSGAPFRKPERDAAGPAAVTDI